jgi:hypothetical protein
MTDELDPSSALNQAADPSDEAQDNGDGDNAYLGEPRRPLGAGTIMVFVGLVAVAGGFALMRWRSGPSVAAASSNPQTVAAQAAITEFLRDRETRLRTMHELLRNTEKVVAQFASFPARNQVPVGELKTNPFRFAAPAERAAEELEQTRKRQEEQRTAARQAVAKLRLQSIVYGQTQRACMINNDLYQEGQEVDGVLIEKINPTSIVVRSGEFRFEIKTRR